MLERVLRDHDIEMAVLIEIVEINDLEADAVS